MSNIMIGSIQFLRGVASLLVLIFHYDVIIRKLWGHAPLGNCFAFGHAGVEFFFVLSGFIIMLVHRVDVGQPRRFWQYLYRRLTRIYPIYWVILSAYVFKLYQVGSPDLSQILSGITLYPVEGYYIVKQAWTLSHEMLFYLVFGVLILNRTWGKVGFVLWFLAIAAQMVFRFIHDERMFIFANYNMLFFIGMLAATVQQNASVWQGRILLSLGVLGFTGTGVLENLSFLHQDESSVVPFGVFSALILLGFIAIERGGALMARRFTDFCGRLSYPLYLSHGAVGAAILPLLFRLMPFAPPFIALLIAAIVALALAYLLHMVVERPLSLLTRRSWKLIAARRESSAS